MDQQKHADDSLVPPAMCFRRAKVVEKTPMGALESTARFHSPYYRSTVKIKIIL